MTTDAAKATGLLQALVGSSLPQLSVGVGNLQLHFDPGLTVSLEGAIRVGAGIAVEPYSLEGVALLLPMLNGDVQEVRADERGSLSLTVGELTLRCDADDYYEAWQYNGSDGAVVVSTPGGQLAIWSSG